jgi:predicted nucleic acid-binding protein
MEAIEMTAHVPPVVVIDTCVILDMFLKDSPRHLAAKSLLDCLTRDRTRVVIPFTGLFEGIANLTRQQAHHGRVLTDPSQKGASLEFSTIPIDEAFFTRYHSESLPPLRTGDLLLFLIAEKDGHPLITEDNELYSISKGAHIRVFRTTEYTAHYG